MEELVKRRYFQEYIELKEELPCSVSQRLFGRLITALAVEYGIDRITEDGKQVKIYIGRDDIEDAVEIKIHKNFLYMQISVRPEYRNLIEEIEATIKKVFLLIMSNQSE